MKWIARLMTSAAAVVVAASGAAASVGSHASPADAAWDEVVKNDTLEAYATFVMMYPESKHARSAYDRLAGVNIGSSIRTIRPGAPLMGDDLSSPDVFPGFLNII